MAIAASSKPRRQRIMGALIFGFLAEIVNKISPLITLSAAQKRLGLDFLGSALFSISVLEICIPLILFGYSYCGGLKLPLLQNDRKAQAELASQILFLRLVHATLTALGLFLATQWIASWREHAGIILWLIPLLFITALDMTFFNYGNQKMSRLSIWTSVFKLLSLAGVLLLVHRPEDAPLFAVLMLASNSCVSLASILWVLPRLGLHRIRWADCWDLLRRASGYAAIAFLYPLFERFDVLVAEKTQSSELLGLYTAPWRLVMSVVPLFMVIANTFLSENMAEKDRAGIARGSHQALFLSLLLTVPILVASPFVAGDILAFVFDETLRPSQGLFTVFTASILTGVFVIILGAQTLLLLGHLRYLSASLVAGIVFGSAFCWIFSHEAGAVGGAYGALLGRLITVGLVFWKLSDILRTMPWKDYLLIPACALIMALGLWLMPASWNIFLRIALGGGLYLASFAFVYRQKLFTLLKRQ